MLTRRHFIVNLKLIMQFFSAQLELIQQLKLDLDLEPKEIYRSIKGRCSKDREFGNSAGAMINLVWEDRIDMKKNMPVSRHTIKPILTMLFIQTLTRKNNIPYVYHTR